MSDLFALSDLNAEFDNEPRIRDILIGERLGYERPRKIRELIEVNLAELEGYGLAPRRGALITTGKARAFHAARGCLVKIARPPEGMDFSDMLRGDAEWILPLLQFQNNARKMGLSRTYAGPELELRNPTAHVRAIEARFLMPLWSDARGFP